MHDMAMGSRLSSIVAELVSDELFKVIESHFKDNIKYMTKFVDDRFFIIRDHIIFDNLWSMLNDYNAFAIYLRKKL